MSEKPKDIQQVKRRQMAKALLAIGAVIALFFLMKSAFNFRWDLTEEHRYSLHPATKEILAQLKEPLEVDILLTGKLPGGMRRFQKNIQETIETFDAYSSEAITFRYFDPLKVEAGDEQQDFVVYLSEFGINPTNLFATEDGNQVSRLIFPGVLVRNAEFETGGLLLKGEKGMSPDEILNLSIENLEYELINMVKRLASPEKKAVAMITNHGELGEDEGYGIVEALSDDYEVYKVPLQQAKAVEDLLSFEAIIIAGPRESYSDREIYLLDQYLMAGGKLLVNLDAVAVNREDAAGQGTLALGFDTGLDRMLFRYGIRVNKDLVQDLNFGYYPVVAGDFGDQSQIVPLPWPFYVVANRMSRHVITKGLDQVMFRFVSSLDTVKADGVTKTPLIFSGNYSRVLSPPVRVAFEDMAQEPDVTLFNRKQLPLVYLLEGEFTSYFKNRFLPSEFEGDPEFQASSTGGAVLVIGDGDWLQSTHQAQTGDPLQLGQDPFSEMSYANREFLQNAVRYLVDPEGIMATRSKELKIRPLDKKRIKDEQSTWQVINVLLPIAVILLLGGLKIYWRKRRFAR